MYTVVIVDDERLVLVDLKSTFSWNEFGFELVQEFTKPLEAIEFIQKNKPDVVFTDIKMPKIDGLQLMNIVKESHPSCLFVVVSGYDEFGYAQNAMRNGAIDYCLKPVGQADAKAVLTRIRNELDKHKRLVDSAPLKIEPTGGGNTFNQILIYINDNIYKSLALDEICEKFFISKNYLCILFKKNLGITFSHYIANTKMKHVEKLIKTTGLSLEQISNAVGYKDYFYFNKIFKKTFGCSPRDYQKRIRGNDVEKTN